LCIGLGGFSARLVINYWPTVKQVLTPPLYATSNERLESAYAKANITHLNWTALLPQTEKQIIAQYQAPQGQAQKLEDMTAQILRSIQASSDKSYQQALISTNTVNNLDNLLISISGFIVPIDFHEDKSVRHLFLVPYFGACLHFPPPSPNQMIFIRLKPGFSELDITQAYIFEGRLNLDLFEDPLGTSAYTLDPISINKFYGQPDDFRKH
jgi:hypothetical protein